MAKWNFNSTYDPKYCQEIVDFMAEGDSLTQFAASLGTHVQTLRGWAKAHKEFNDAIQTAQAMAESWWESLSKKMTLGADETIERDEKGRIQRKCSDKLLMFVMRSRFKNYKDVLTLEVADEVYMPPLSLIPDHDDPNHSESTTTAH